VRAVSAYPASPWHLRGQLYASAFLVPVRDLHVELPPGCSLVRFAGRAVVGVVWVDYQPGGVLTYRELMTTVLVRRGLRLLPTITHIWVDSEASRDGGRALWGIPKELAEFTFAHGRFAARDGHGRVAVGSVRTGRRLPLRLPVRFRIVQTKDGRPLVTPVRATASVSVGKGSFDARRPLAFLTGRRPVGSFVLSDFDMRFGRHGEG
jgi:hypothetical protein